MRRGLIHLYTGDGKGKTTAAVGLAVRAAGRGLRVWFVQLMKGRPSGEIPVLEQIAGITVRRAGSEKFSFQMTEGEAAAVRQAQDALLLEAMAHEDKTDLLILDEALSAVTAGLLDEELLRRLVCRKPQGLEVVLTGRDPRPWMVEAADYLTEMVKRRHPFDRGVPARDGIEE